MIINYTILGELIMILLMGFFMILGIIYFFKYLIPTIDAQTIARQIENYQEKQILVMEKEKYYIAKHHLKLVKHGNIDIDETEEEAEEEPKPVKPLHKEVSK